MSSRQELAELADELADRFGPPPEMVRRLLAVAELRIAAAGWSIDSIHREAQYVVLRYRDRPRIEALARALGGRLRIVDQRSAYLPMDKAVSRGEPLLGTVKSLLLSAGAPPTIPPA